MLCQKHNHLNCTNVRCVALRKQKWYKEKLAPGEVAQKIIVQAPITYTSDELQLMSKEDLTKLAIDMPGWELSLNKEELIVLVLGGSSP